LEGRGIVGKSRLRLLGDEENSLGETGMKKWSQRTKSREEKWISTYHNGGNNF
jgi:hypothetical protein